MDQPWNDWYHVMTHTYSTWLPGDPRGFRTRGHREHVDGDYKNPPPKGKWDERLKRSKKLLKRPPIYLTIEQRTRACDEIVESFKRHKVEILSVSMNAVHLHVLMRCPLRNPKHLLGIAKKECSHFLNESGHGVEGGIWALNCSVKPIKDREHQVEVFNYILKHRFEGAAVWSFNPDALN